MRAKLRKFAIHLIAFCIPFRELRHRFREQMLQDGLAFDKFQDMQEECVRHLSYPECVTIPQLKNPPTYLPTDSTQNFLNILLNLPAFEYDGLWSENEELYFCWEIRPTGRHIKILKKAQLRNKKVLFVGDGFLRSISPNTDSNALSSQKKGISFTIDDITSYFDATRQSRLEQMLNDKNLIILEEERNYAQECIHSIIETHLTKYNHQPIFEPNIGRNGVKKILVVDQAYGDMSVVKGLASAKTFKKMLREAVAHNPDADIIVKTHPDTMAGKKGGYYTDIKPHNNIYTMTEPINPISLIKYVDKVYVCTTQLGFEALMCGKETHVFGLPFYAGWGLTHDRQKCKRRTNTRSLEEIFYIAYVIYSRYVNPKTQKVCEIEEAMKYLLEQVKR